MMGIVGTAEPAGIVRSDAFVGRRSSRARGFEGESDDDDDEEEEDEEEDEEEEEEEDEECLCPSKMCSESRMRDSTT